MEKRNAILIRWYESIKDFKRLTFNEAKELYIKILNTKDELEKQRLRQELINNTLYVVLKYVEAVNFDFVKSGSFDLDDIISASIEYYINSVDDGIFLNVDFFSRIFNKKYYIYLANTLVSNKNTLELNDCCTKEIYVSLIEYYIKLKKENVNATFNDYLLFLAKTDIFNRFNIMGLHFDFSEYRKFLKNDINVNLFKEYNFPDYDNVIVVEGQPLSRVNNLNILKLYFDFFEKLSDMVDDVEKLRSAKVINLRQILFESELISNISNDIVDPVNYEDIAISGAFLENILSYIEGDTNLSDKNKEIFLDRYGIYDNKYKTLQEMSDKHSLTIEGIRRHEVKVLNRLRNKFIKMI